VKAHNIEAYGLLTIKVVLPSEVAIAAFEGAGEPCLVFLLELLASRSLAEDSADVHHQFFAEEFELVS